MDQNSIMHSFGTNCFSIFDMISTNIIKAVQEALEIFAVVVGLFFNNLNLWNLVIDTMFNSVFLILNIVFKIRQGFSNAGI